MTEPEGTSHSAEPKPSSKVGKALNTILSEEERKAFYDHSSDRVMAIVFSQIVENHLTTVLRLVMRRDKKLADELFNPSGPLGPFGTKIRLAYMLRMLHETSYKDLLTINRIRNRFAHDLSITSFEDQQITAWIKNMHMYSIVKKMGEEAQERIKMLRGRKLLLSDRDQFSKDYIKSNALLSSKDSYRDCLRYIIHFIVDQENSILESEAKLNEKPSDASPSPDKS